MKIISTALSNTLPNTDLTANNRLQKSEASDTDPAASNALELNDSLQGANASTADINMNRVNEIRQAISDGTLQVDSSRIFDGMAESVMEMNGQATE
ncbi:flagellar biosynthesis anti-sigma factor FlgM [Pseudomonas sp. RIT-To-2]|uniref:flagellar biosynthesis anti-sigma factor FlgM n=1 Tax=Pseudomonas sp. RIT-To-2 TaxID=3462541 RepID=UPI00241306D8